MHEMFTSLLKTVLATKFTKISLLKITACTVRGIVPFNVKYSRARYFAVNII